MNPGIVIVGLIVLDRNPLRVSIGSVTVMVNVSVNRISVSSSTAVQVMVAVPAL